MRASTAGDQLGPNSDRLVELTEQLLEQEQADAKELRRMAKEMRDIKDTTMWELLVRLVEMDTARHVEILSCIRDHAGEPLV